LPVLACSIPFIFIPKKNLVLVDDKHDAATTMLENMKSGTQ
jgi:hypothetical protein